MGVLFILTGTTKGLGEALAKQILTSTSTEEHHLVTLSRKPTQELIDLAAKHAIKLTHINVDLQDATAVAGAAKQISDVIAGTPTSWKLRVIQNAGVVAPVLAANRLTELDAINAAFQINITAPIMLNGHILAAAQAMQDKRIMLISSGAGRSPTAGWGVYCATKAAMDRYVEVVALEQGEKLRITSMAPGIIDTAMQVQIRASSPEDFPAIERFKGFHEQGQLGSAETIASRLLTAFELADYGSKPIYDIRQYTF